VSQGSHNFLPDKISEEEESKTRHALHRDSGSIFSSSQEQNGNKMESQMGKQVRLRHVLHDEYNMSNNFFSFLS